MCTSPPCFLSVLQLEAVTSALQIRTFRCLAFPAQRSSFEGLCNRPGNSTEYE
uniref:Uncharacterized protein n=1 Tax=Anguilla anguilla TaxID=7936 RepID=A0A0E9T5A4_ANGAN